MRVAYLIAGPLLIFAASGIAQAAPSPAHEQHEATGQHPAAAAAGEQRCCCEDMMRKMMSEMMQQHQGMQTPSPKDGAHPDQPQSH